MSHDSSDEFFGTTADFMNRGRARRDDHRPLFVEPIPRGQVGNRQRWLDELEMAVATDAYRVAEELSGDGWCDECLSGALDAYSVWIMERVGSAVAFGAGMFGLSTCSTPPSGGEVAA